MAQLGLDRRQVRAGGKKTDFRQTFYNTVLGESYSLGGETPNDARL
jgi:hypothetical protein